MNEQLLLDHVVEREARWVLTHLYTDSGWAFSDYQPGNGTAYPLLFLHLKPPSWAPLSYTRFDHGIHKGFVLVSWIGHGSYQFDLLNPHGYSHPSYIQEKLRAFPSDADAIAALFNRIVQVNSMHDHIHTWQTVYGANFDPEVDDVGGEPLMFDKVDLIPKEKPT